MQDEPRATQLPEMHPDDVPQWTNISDYLESIKSNLNGPLPLFVNAADDAIGILVKNLGQSKSLRAVGLINYAYSAWRCSVSLSLSGNAHQVPMVLRPALEAMTYAALIKHDEKWRDTWAGRHASRNKADRLRREGPAAARAKVRSLDPNLEADIRELTDTFIDFGGHPNVGAVEASSKYYQHSELPDMGFVVFHQLGDATQRFRSLVRVAQVGEIFLRILQLLWPDRFLLLGTEARQRKFLTLVRDFLEINRGSKSG